jgi:hypothetical protein
VSGNCEHCRRYLWTALVMFLSLRNPLAVRAAELEFDAEKVAGAELPTQVEPALPRRESEMLSIESGEQRNRAPPSGFKPLFSDVLSNWQLPPIRFWGDVAYDFRRTDIDAQPGFVRHSLITNLNASTYIYEPWLAIVSAGVGLTTSRLNDGELASSDRFATGYARLNIFPQSRFPFEARYLRSDNLVDSDVAADQNYRQTRYGLTQKYRTEDGSTQYSASFDHFTQDGTTVGKDVQDALQVDVNTQFRRHHDLQLLGTWNHNRRIDTGERNDYETLLARHAFRPSPAFSLENSVNLTHTDNRFAFTNSDLRIFQLNSIAFWRPEHQRFTANGSLRLFSLENGTGQDSINTKLVNATAGANYTVSQNLRVLGGISLTDADTAGQQTRTAVGTLGATYQGDTVELNKYRYDWFAAGTGIYSSGESDRSGGAFNGQLGHSLNRGFELGHGGALSFSVAQNVSAIVGAQEDSSKQLLHTGSITWNKTEAESNATSLIRLSATDSRFLDGQKETFQLFNLQMTRAQEFGRDQSFSGNLTIQAARNRSQRPGFDIGVQNGKFGTTASAELVYRHQNIFRVPRLVFFSQLRLNRAEVIQNLGSPGERELRSWENRVDYNIGRLEMRFLMRIADIDGTRQRLVMFRIMRRFGN